MYRILHLTTVFDLALFPWYMQRKEIQETDGDSWSEEKTNTHSEIYCFPQKIK